MVKEEKKALVPKLRFPEFRRAQVWTQHTLGSVASFFKGKGLPKSAIVSTGARPCIHYGELFTEYPEAIREIQSRTDVEGDLFLSVENDVLMPTSDVTPGGLAKACCLSIGGVILGGDILVIRTDGNSVNGEFLARYIRHLKTKVLRLVSGSTVYHLYASSMQKLELSFPFKAEQQKIADCLSSLDELIAAQGRKVEALKSYKRGLMQQLFPREGETLPRLRFPEFRIAPEWACATLGSVTRFSSGGTPSKDKASYWNGSIPWISASSMHDMRVFSSDLKVTPQAIGNGTRLAPKGSLLILVRGSMLFKRVPICIVLVDVAFNQDVKALAVCDGVSAEFLLYQLLALSPRIQVNETGIGAGKIETDTLAELSICLPSMAEQERIVDSLSFLEEQATDESEKLNLLKAHKSGLMQQLFPSLVEA